MRHVQIALVLDAAARHADLMERSGTDQTELRAAIEAVRQRWVESIHEQLAQQEADR